MKHSRIKAAISAAAVGLLVLTGCSSSDSEQATHAESWDEIVAAAQDEGSVTIYATHSPTNLEALKVAFEEEYPGIVLNYVRGTDADILPKVEVEHQTGTGVADVHMTTDQVWIKNTLESDYSTKIVAPSLDNPDFQSANSVIGEKFFLTSGNVFGLGWNTQEVPEGLSSPQDIIDPRFKGKVGIQNPSGTTTYVDMYKTVDTAYGDDYLADLVTVEPRIYNSAVAITQALASGEVWAAPMAASNVLTEQAKGAPVDFTLPETPWGVPWYSHVLASAPNPNAAQLLADFILTPKGQEAISADYLAVLPNIPGTGIKGTDVLAQDLPLANVDELDPESVAAYQAQWEKDFLK